MRNITLLFMFTALISCSKPLKQIKISNGLAFDRQELITVPIDDLGITDDQAKSIIVKKGDAILPTQLIDADGDGSKESLLIEASIEARATVTLDVHNGTAAIDSIPSTYGRFVPERIDDFAWENNRVAFRTYGPEAQRLVDQNEKGGTLSSGIDCWLKRVDYPIIDKWYAKHVAGGSYHQDSGEGYDPYHVGASRGCGGLGVLAGDSLFVSKNFISHKVLANGPLRTVFELRYAPWPVNNIMIEERKVISIDHDQQFCKVEAYLNSDSAMNYTVGITLHDKKGSTRSDSKAGWSRYWEIIDDSELGTGVVIDPKYTAEHREFKTDKKDLSHLYITSKLNEAKLVYYPGFAWKKAGRITTAEAWDKTLSQFSERLRTPLVVEVSK